MVINEWNSLKSDCIACMSSRCDLFSIASKILLDMAIPSTKHENNKIFNEQSSWPNMVWIFGNNMIKEHGIGTLHYNGPTSAHASQAFSTWLCLFGTFTHHKIISLLCRELCLLLLTCRKFCILLPCWLLSFGHILQTRTRLSCSTQIIKWQIVLALLLALFVWYKRLL